MKNLMILFIRTDKDLSSQSLLQNMITSYNKKLLPNGMSRKYLQYI